MTPKCDEHSGVCAQVEDLKDDIAGFRTSEREQWSEIRKKPSTTTLLVILGIVGSVIMTIVGLVYQSHENQIARLERTDAVLFKKLDDQYEKIDSKLEDLKRYHWEGPGKKESQGAEGKKGK